MIKAKRTQNGAEFGTGFVPFGLRGRVLHDARTGKQAYLITLDGAATDGNDPFSVALGVTPADDATKQLPVKRLKLFDKIARCQRWGTA
ncbi:hypothetical protein D3C81_1995820 [compost metagenome]